MTDDVAAPAASRDLIVGPMSFFESNGKITGSRLGGLRSWKVPVIVEGGKRVTVTIARPHRQVAAIIGEDRPRTLSDGQRRVVYTACPTSNGPRTGWPGGFLTKRATLCLQLHVTVQGEGSHQVRLPLGRRAC